MKIRIYHKIVGDKYDKKIFAIFYTKRKIRIEKEIEKILIYKLESKSELNEIQLEYFYFLLQQLDAPKFNAIKGFEKLKKNICY